MKESLSRRGSKPGEEMGKKVDEVPEARGSHQRVQRAVKGRQGAGGGRRETT